MKQFNIFGDDSTSDSEEDVLIMALSDVSSSEDDVLMMTLSDVSSSEDDSDIALLSSPLSAAPVLVADLQANNEAAPPIAQRPVFELASCLCQGTRGRTCLESCACLQDSLECGESCGCKGLCSNGPVDEDKLYVARSTLPGAGNGCFAAVDLGKYELAGEYRGKILPSKVARASSDKTYHAVLTTSPGGLTIDGKDGPPATRANHRANGPNCIAVRRYIRVGSRQSTALFLKAIEDIPRDHELFWDYGKDYDPGSFAK